MSYEERDTYGMYKSYGEGPGPRLMGADTLIGEDVYNHKDEDLGDIKEIMLDMNTGEVAYAVLSFGGFLGIADKLFAVPWSALKLDTENKRFILNVDKERLETAPGFDKDHWPDMADPSWQNTISAFYGTQSYTEPSHADTSYRGKKSTPEELIPEAPPGADKVVDKRKEAYEALADHKPAPPPDTPVPESPSGPGIVIDKRNEAYKPDTRPAKPSDRIIPEAPSGPGIVIDKRNE